MIVQYLIFPNLLLYVLSSAAEAIQTDTNDNNEITSRAIPKELTSSERGMFSKDMMNRKVAL